MSVQGTPVTESIVLTTEQRFFLDMYRSFFSMRLTAAEGSVYILDSKLGDAELWEDLRLGINLFNSWPPNITFIKFKQLYRPLQQAQDRGENILTGESTDASSLMLSPIFMCALFWTGVRLQWFEAGKHFEYNDNGISIIRRKQQDYGNIINGSVLQFLSAQLSLLKRTLKFQITRPKGLFSGGLGFPRSLTRGQRGTRLGASL
ncbi:MAG: hypothetical protein M0R03_03490 [Novosphingobium sp.]|nr:hypothetical protein [Novosphingobium sp.]